MEKTDALRGIAALTKALSHIANTADTGQGGWRAGDAHHIEPMIARAFVALGIDMERIGRAVENEKTTIAILGKPAA